MLEVQQSPMVNKIFDTVLEYRAINTSSKYMLQVLVFGMNTKYLTKSWGLEPFII